MEPKPRPRRPGGKRASLAQWIERERPSLIGETEWDALRAALHPISAGYLRRLLREAAAPLAPVIEGVRQDTFEALEASLLKLLDEYERGDAARRTAVRKLVIEAKDHARWSAKKPEKRAEKEEMVLWLLTWLENPPLFPAWARLRRDRI